MSIKEFENILDDATIKLGDYTDTYNFFRDSWGMLITQNPYMRLKEAIEIKDMHDSMCSKQSKVSPVKPNYSRGKNKKKKKKRK